MRHCVGGWVSEVGVIALPQQDKLELGSQPDEEVIIRGTMGEWTSGSICRASLGERAPPRSSRR